MKAFFSFQKWLPKRFPHKSLHKNYVRKKVLLAMHCDMKDYADERGNLHFIKIGELSDTLNWMELSFVVEVNSLRNQSYSSSTGQQVSQGKRILGIHCTQVRKHASVTRSPKQRCRWLHKKMFFDSFKKVSPYDLEFLQRYSLFLTYVEDSFTRSRQILFQICLCLPRITKNAS